MTGKDRLRLSVDCPEQPIDISKFMERGIPSTGKPCDSPMRKLVINFANHTISEPSRVDFLAFAVGTDLLNDFGPLIYAALGFTAGFIVASVLACSFCCCTL